MSEYKLVEHVVIDRDIETALEQGKIDTYDVSHLRLKLRCNEDNALSEKWDHGIALHYFDADKIQWRSFHEFMLGAYKDLGFAPSDTMLRGEPYGRKTSFLRYKNGLKKLEKNDFQGLTALDFMSDGASFNIDAGFRYEEFVDPNSNKAHAWFFIDEKIRGPEKDWLLDLAANLQKFTGAKYGYNFRCSLEANPGSYITGWDRLSTTVDEYLRVKKWMRFLGNLSIGRAGEKIGMGPGGPIYQRTRYKLEEKALRHFRDIYEFNFLSDFHLNLPVDASGTTLGAWIKADEANRGNYLKLHENFYCWIITCEDKRAYVRQALASSGIIICI